MKYLLAIACVVIAACSPPQPPKSTVAPTPGVRVRAGELRTVPKLQADVAARASDELTAALNEVYGRAFLGRGVLADLFTPDAAAGLTAQANAFRPDAPVTHGTLTWKGLATATSGSATTAWLQTIFAAAAPAERLSQTGTLLLIRTPQGWRIGGFDVQLTVRRQAGSPSPVAARYMP